MSIRGVIFNWIRIKKEDELLERGKRGIYKIGYLGFQAND
jgi:hypothetical protein